MPYPIGSTLNQVPGPPYDSQREALLYEILQALGGNPDKIMSKPWTPGNEGNARPPYTALTDALLYEIWMVINDGGGGGGGANTAIVYYGLVQDGATINPVSGFASKIIQAQNKYYIVPPAISNLAGNETVQVRLWVAEPVSEPAKAGTLWLRNVASTFLNEGVGAGAIMQSQIISGYRVYVSEPMNAEIFNGTTVGPVFFSQHREITLGGGGPPPPQVYSHQIRFSEQEQTICAQQWITAYSTSPTIQKGITLWANEALTQNLWFNQGINFITNQEGTIFYFIGDTVDDPTGQVC